MGPAASETAEDLLGLGGALAQRGGVLDELVVLLGDQLPADRPGEHGVEAGVAGAVDALQAFAGPDWQNAVNEPEEEHMLAQVFCDHYETIDTG